MLELLILYALNKREQTLYSLKKSIAEYFGEVSNPSHGALHPALKRLMDKKVVGIRKKFSDGGKRYTYYSLESGWKTFFDEKFLQLNSSQTETFEAYLSELKVKLLIIDVFDKAKIKDFKEKYSLKLNYYVNKTEEKLKDSYIELTDIQKSVLQNILKEAEIYKTLLKEVK